MPIWSLSLQKNRHHPYLRAQLLWRDIWCLCRVGPRSSLVDCAVVKRHNLGIWDLWDRAGRQFKVFQRLNAGVKLRRRPTLFKAGRIVSFGLADDLGSTCRETSPSRLSTSLIRYFALPAPGVSTNSKGPQTIVTTWIYLSQDMLAWRAGRAVWWWAGSYQGCTEVEWWEDVQQWGFDRSFSDIKPEF